MVTTISKRFRWEMGHRLPMHDGLCRNLHGHSYTMEVFLSGEPDATGMVMDYFDVTTLVQPLVDRFDHCFVVDKSDTEVLQFLAQHQMKTVVIDAPTTAENLAAYVLHAIIEQLENQHNLVSIAVSVNETEKTSAVVTHVF